LIAEILGDRQGHETGAHAQGCGPLGSGDDYHGALTALGAQFVVYEARTSRFRSPIMAITVTSAELWRAMLPSSVLLPTPLPPKIPMRCPRPQGREAVDGAYARDQRFGDVLAFERIPRLAVQTVSARRLDARSAIDRLAKAIDDAAEQPQPNLDPRIFAARHHHVA